MKQLLTILLARLNTIPGLKNIELYNNQLTRSIKQNEAVFFPAVYLEILGQVSYESGLDDYQYGTATVRVHVVSESPLQGADLSIYELKDTIHSYLHKYSTGFFNGLVRTNEETDTNHDNLYIYKIDYTTRFTEFTHLIEDESEGVINEVDVQYDLYDDTDEIVTDKINRA